METLQSQSEQMSKARICRATHSSEQPYFLMARQTAQDRSLSWEARGLLAYLLSKPDNWDVQIADLQQECGRDKVYRILNELIDAGYVSRKRIMADETSKPGVVYYAYETSFKSSDGNFLKSPTMASPSHHPDSQDTEKPDVIYKREEQNTDSSFADAQGSPDALKLTEVWKDKTTGEVKAQEVSLAIPMSAIPGRWCLGAGETRQMHFVVDDGGPIKSKALCGVHPFTYANPVKLIGPAMEYCPDCLNAGSELLCPDRPPKRKAERKADPVFDAIALGSFNMPKATNGSGGRIARLSKDVRACVPEEHRDTLGDDLGKMYAWYKTKYPNLSAPAAAETICKYLAEWRGTLKPCRDDIDKKLGGHYEEREIKPGVFKKVFVKIGGEVIYS